MNITDTTVQLLTITDVPGLDTIRVYLEDYEPGRGRITISCYGRAWTAYWGGMYQATLKQFVPSCGADYIRDNLVRGMEQRMARTLKAENAYLLRVVEAVQEALRRQLRFELHGVYE